MANTTTTIRNKKPVTLGPGAQRMVTEITALLNRFPARQRPVVLDGIVMEVQQQWTGTGVVPRTAKNLTAASLQAGVPRTRARKAA